MKLAEFGEGTLPLTILENPAFLSAFAPALLGDGGKVLGRSRTALSAAEERQEDIVANATPAYLNIEMQAAAAEEALSSEHAENLATAESDHKNRLVDNETTYKERVAEARRLYELACKMAQNEREAADLASTTQRDNDRLAADNRADSGKAELTAVEEELSNLALRDWAISLGALTAYAERVQSFQDGVIEPMDELAKQTRPSTEVSGIQRSVERLRDRIDQHVMEYSSADSARKGELTRDLRTMRQMLDEEQQELERLTQGNGDEINYDQQRKAAEALSKAIGEGQGIPALNKAEEARLKAAIKEGIVAGTIDPKKLIDALVEAVRTKQMAEKKKD